MSGYHQRMPPPWHEGPMAAPRMPMGHPAMMHPIPYPPYPGFCPSCCHPVSMCVCGCRECRKEAKELLVTPGTELKDELARRRALHTFAYVHRPAEGSVFEATEVPLTAEREELLGISREIAGMGEAYIGGGCCVHLSVEYTSMNEESVVGVAVFDSENTILAWAKRLIPPGYYVKEDIISTKPGAALLAVVENAIARVRWCEVFSC